MEKDTLSLESQDKVFQIDRYKIGPLWFINGTLTDILFQGGIIVPAQDPDFVRIFRARISKNVTLDKDGVVLFSRKAYAHKDDVDKVKFVVAQLPPDTYILASIKTLNAYKSPRIVVPERDNNRQARFEFELSGVFYT